MKNWKKIFEGKFCFPRGTNVCEYKLFTEVAGMHVEQVRAFQASAAVGVIFIFNVFRLQVNWFHSTVRISAGQRNMMVGVFGSVTCSVISGMLENNLTVYTKLEDKQFCRCFVVVFNLILMQILQHIS
jgi:hypothetical protein